MVDLVDPLFQRVFHLNVKVIIELVTRWYTGLRMVELPKRFEAVLYRNRCRHRRLLYLFNRYLPAQFVGQVNAL